MGNIYFYGNNKDAKKSLIWWSLAAKNGSSDARCSLASAYFYGDFIEENKKLSFELYSSERDECGIYNLYKFYEKGFFVEKNIKKAMEILLEIKAKCKNKTDQIVAGSLMGEDIDVAVDRVNTELAIEDGNGDAMFKKGQLYDAGGENDYQKAAFWYKKAAEHGNKASVNRLWEMYDLGLVDDEKGASSALYYLMQAAELGFVKAKRKLGWMHFDGDGVDKDYKKSADYFQSAADSGDVESQYVFGLMLINGEVSKNEEMAFRYIKMAASGGDPDAMYRLFLMYKDGVGVMADQKLAVEYLEKSAFAGVSQGQLALGVMRAYGKGTRKDIVDAYVWLNLASDNGDKNAGEYRGVVESQMTRQQIAEALEKFKRVRSMQPSLALSDADGVSFSERRISSSNGNSEVKLVNHAGVYAVPILVNDVLTINFIVDSGAADVFISSDVASTLLKTGTITNNDLLEDAIYTMANGTQVKSKRFIVRSMRVGSKEIRDVVCAVSSDKDAALLLGQSALRKLGSYEIDYKKGVMAFK